MNSQRDSSYDTLCPADKVLVDARISWVERLGVFARVTAVDGDNAVTSRAHSGKHTPESLRFIREALCTPEGLRELKENAHYFGLPGEESGNGPAR